MSAVPPKSQWGKDKAPNIVQSSNTAAKSAISAQPTKDNQSSATKPANNNNDSNNSNNSANSSTSSGGNAPSNGSSVFAAAAAAVASSPGSNSMSSVYSSTLATGNLVRITTALGEKIEGIVFVYDPAVSTVALEQSVQQNPAGEAKNYIICPTEGISVELLQRSAGSSGRKLPELNIQALAQREEKAIAARRAESAKIGKNVTPLAQKLFDSIIKQYRDARWEGSSIAVLDISIVPPYQPNNVQGKHAKSVENFKKFLENERKRLQIK